MKLVVTYARAIGGALSLLRTKWISSRHHFSCSHGVALSCNTADATVSASPYLRQVSRTIRHDGFIQPEDLTMLYALFFYAQAMSALLAEDIVEANDPLSVLDTYALSTHEYMMLKIEILKITYT